MNVAELFGEHARRSFAEGRMLPVEVYRSEQVAEAERHMVFANGWIAVAHVADLATVGSFVVVDVPSVESATQRSIIVIRGESGAVAAFENACVHRGAELLAGCGTTSRITCPYHAWVYRLDGSLVGGPYMQGPAEDNTAPVNPAEHSLAALHVEQWQGFVFVNQHPTPTTLSGRLTGLADVVERFDMAGYVTVHQQVDVWATNWKLLVENFMDAYHVFKVHRSTFAADGDNTLDTTMFPGTDDWAHHRVVHESGDDIAHPDNTTLTGSWRRTVVLAAVFPTFVIQLQPDWLWWLQISPIGTDRVQIRWQVAIAPEMLAAQSDRDAYIADVLDLLIRVNAEDQPVVEGVRRTMNQPQFSRGPLSYLERNVYDFDRYIARRLSDTPLD